MLVGIPSKSEFREGTPLSYVQLQESLGGANKTTTSTHYTTQPEYTRQIKIIVFKGLTLRT